MVRFTIAVMPLLSDLTFDLDDPQYGTPIPYAPYHLVESSYSGPALTLGYESGSSTQITYVCPWVYHDRFCQLMLGVNYVDSDGTRDRLFRTSPHFLPIYGYTNMYATRVASVMGIAGPDPYEYVTGSSGTKIERPTMGVVTNDNSPGIVLKYAYAKVTVEYQPLPYYWFDENDTPYDQEWLRFTTIQRTPRVEFLQVQAGTLKWIDSPVSASPEVVPNPIPIRDQSVDYVVTWHRVPFVITDFDAFVGYANSNSGFLSGHPQVPTGGFDADRMLLIGVQETLIPQPWSNSLTDDQLYTYAFFFQDRFNGHNSALRRQGSGASTTFDYCDFSFTGSTATLNTQRAIKHANMANLFAAR